MKNKVFPYQAFGLVCFKSYIDMSLSGDRPSYDDKVTFCEIVLQFMVITESINISTKILIQVPKLLFETLEFYPNVSTEFSEFSDQIFVEKKSLLKPTTIDLHTLVVTTCQSDGLRTLLRVKLLTSDLGRMIYPPSSPPTQSKNFLCTTSTSLVVRMVPCLTCVRFL